MSKKSISIVINNEPKFAKKLLETENLVEIIGRGAFGEVHVCKEKKTGNIVAIKKIKKSVIETKNQIIHIRNEQLLMSKIKSPCIVDLKESFQEGERLKEKERKKEKKKET